MKFDFKQVALPSRAAKRLPKDVTSPRAYKVKPKGGKVIGMVIGTDLAGKPGWSVWRNGKLSGGHGTRQHAAEALAGGQS